MTVTTNDRLILTEVKGRSLWTDARRRLMRNKAAVASMIWLVFITLVCVFASFIAPHPYAEVNWDMTPAQPPNWELGYYFGSDENGRDLFTRILYGGQISLSIAVVASLISLVIGVIWGATAGYIGGRVDGLMMRIVDILYAIPFIFFIILLSVVFERNLSLMFFAIGAVSWLNMARIVRGQTLSLRRKEFVEAAHASGVRTWKIVLRHIVPNTLGPVVIYLTLTVPEIILTESFVSFLGMGVQEPFPSWGTMISEGARTMQSAPHALIFPAIVLVLTLLSLNFLGDGLRDALDPKDR